MDADSVLAHGASASPSPLIDFGETGGTLEKG